MESLTLARVIHVLGVVLWIGGVAMVTTVILPWIRQLPQQENPVAFFEHVEQRFARQARVVTALTGLSGFYLVHRMGVWSRYLSAEFWWIHAMTLIWLVFTLVLFVLEPLLLRDLLIRRAERDPAGTLAIIQRAHWVLLTLSLITVAGAIAGSHGWSFRLAG
ncbi:MAG: hypothetical protein QNK04_30885 [Myxococcota bacterium]|nr:hypothetical protein [Myxococcota bacterium]